MFYVDFPIVCVQSQLSYILILHDIIILIEFWKPFFCFFQIIQNEGYFVVTWCGAYHAGINLGPNIAKISDFDSPEWISILPKYRDCDCELAEVQLENSQCPAMDIATISRKRGKYNKPERPHEVSIFLC